MKFKFDIECTPVEARQFIGLPDVSGLQGRLLAEVEAKMQENLRNLDPETFVKTWFPATAPGWGDLQKMFWGQMGMSPAPAHSTDKDDKK